MNPKDIITRSQTEMLIQNNKVLIFDYVKEDLEITKGRVVLPMQIVTGPTGENDRFLGYDFTKNGLRQFLFKGMEEVRPVLLSEGLLSI